MTKKFIIYRLFDKRFPEIPRYVGLTTNLTRRLTEHLSCTGQNPGKDAWIKTPGVDMVGEVIDTRECEAEARYCEAYWINHYKEMGMPLTNQFIPARVTIPKHRSSHLKILRVSLPEDSPALADLLDYGRQLGTDLPETTLRVLREWSQAMRGQVVLGPHCVPTFAQTTSRYEQQWGRTERERAKAGDARSGRRLKGEMNG